MTAATIFTRRDYLAASREQGSYHRYYSQFVTEHTVRVVVDVIGGERILASTDPHFNDIPLINWDVLPAVYDKDKLKLAGDYITLAGKVSIMKTAARMWRDGEAVVLR